MNTFFKSLLCVFMLGTINCGDKSQEKDKSQMLNNKEAATLRKIVYTKGLVTSHEVSNTGMAYRVLVVPADFEKLYKSKRVAALRLLLDIVKGGRAQDALSAAAFAIAMEDNLISATKCVDQSPNGFDEDPVDLGITPRGRLADWLEDKLRDIGGSK